MPLASPRPATQQPARTLGALILAGLVLGVLFGGVVWWRGARQAGSAVAYAPPPVEVAAEPVRFETLPQSLEATGSLQAVQQVMLAPEVAGRIVAIHFDSGAEVVAGAPLVQLFDAPERADHLAAASRAEFARIQYNRSLQLAPSNAEPRQILQQRAAELAQAEAATQQIDARIVQKNLNAPFAGRLGIRRINLGQYVNAGDPIATLTALDPLYANVIVPQQDLSKIAVGGGVEITSDAFPGRRFAGKISAIEPVVGADTRNVSVQATLANPDQVLRPGLYVTASIGQPAKPRAIVVPATAIQTSASGDTVFVVRDGRAAVVPVVTGERVGERVVVEVGLAPGDTIITSGQLRVQPGSPVRIAGSPPRPPR